MCVAATLVVVRLSLRVVHEGKCDVYCNMSEKQVSERDLIFRSFIKREAAKEARRLQGV